MKNLLAAVLAMLLPAVATAQTRPAGGSTAADLLAQINFAREYPKVMGQALTKLYTDNASQGWAKQYQPAGQALSQESGVAVLTEDPTLSQQAQQLLASVQANKMFSSSDLQTSPQFFFWYGNSADAANWFLAQPDYRNLLLASVTGNKIGVAAGPNKWVVVLPSDTGTNMAAAVAKKQASLAGSKPFQLAESELVALNGDQFRAKGPSTSVVRSIFRLATQTARLMLSGRMSTGKKSLCTA